MINKGKKLRIVIFLFILLLLVSIICVVIYIVGLPVSVETISEAEITITRGKNIHTCQSPCKVNLPIGNYTVTSMKKGYLQQIENITITPLKTKFSFPAIPLPTFFIQQTLTSKNLSDYGWVGNTSVYKLDNDLFDTDDNSLVLSLPQEEHEIIWDQNNKFIGYLRENSYWKFNNSHIFQEVKLEKTGKSVAVWYDQFIAFFSDNKLNVTSLTTGKSTVDISLPKENIQGKELYFIGPNNLLVKAQENNSFSLYNFDILNKEFTVLFSDQSDIYDIQISPDRQTVSFINNNTLQFLKNKESKAVSLKTNTDSEEILDYRHLWINNNNVLLFEKVKDFRTIDNIYIVNSETVNEEFLETTIAIPRRIDFSCRLKISKDKSQIMIKENKSNLWFINLDISDLPESLQKALETDDGAS